VVSIVTDSTADLSPELIERYHIHIIPFPVHHGGCTYYDGVDIDAGGLYGLVEATGELPTTAAPPIAAYLAAFDRPGDIVFTGIGAALSAGYQCAKLAAAEFPDGKVRLIDSQNLSTGTGLLVLRAAELRDLGCPADEIERELRAAVPWVRTAFVVDTLRYIYMGGRCTGVERLLGSLLHIRPVIAVEPDGTLGIRQKVRGTRRHALQTLLDDLAANLPEIDRSRVFVTHSGSEDAQWVADEVKRIAAPQEMLVTQAGCTISTHCGPNTTGIIYMVKGQETGG
jgi:DegV family protein with EDD domain